MLKSKKDNKIPVYPRKQNKTFDKGAENEQFRSELCGNTADKN